MVRCLLSSAAFRGEAEVRLTRRQVSFGPDWKFVKELVRFIVRRRSEGVRLNYRAERPKNPPAIGLQSHPNEFFGLAHRTRELPSRRSQFRRRNVARALLDEFGHAFPEITYDLLGNHRPSMHRHGVSAPYGTLRFTVVSFVSAAITQAGSRSYDRPRNGPSPRRTAARP